MAFHHRSSASLSSVSLSRTSPNSTSSSQSSPSSSPECVPTRSSLAHQKNHGISPAPSAAIVPFLWEEKPGVTKKEFTGAGNLGEHCDNANTSLAFPCQVNGNRADAECVCKVAAHANSLSSSGCETSCAPPVHLKTPAFSCRRSPQVCLPPRVSHSEQRASVAGGREFPSPPLPPSYRNHVYTSGDSSATAVGSKIISSLPLHKRHHRRAPSLEDDPFWRAMVACINDADKAPPGGTVPEANPGACVARKVSRTDSWLTRMGDYNTRLDRCMPRHRRPSERRTTSMKAQIDRKQYSAINQAIHSGAVGASKPSKCPSSVKINHPNTDAGYRGDVTEMHLESLHLNHSPSKALNALSRAKAELQGRCRALLHREGPPMVDISCRSRLAAMSKVGTRIKSQASRPFRVAEEQ